MTALKDRWTEYQLCKKRGHQPAAFVLATNPPKRQCVHCGTTYWTTSVQHESGAPKNPEESA